MFNCINRDIFHFWRSGWEMLRMKKSDASPWTCSAFEAASCCATSVSTCSPDPSWWLILGAESISWINPGMLLALTWLVIMATRTWLNIIKQNIAFHRSHEFSWIFHISIAGTFWWNSPPRSKKYRRWPKYVSTRVAWPKMRMELEWTQQPIASILDYPIDFTMDSSPQFRQEIPVTGKSNHHVYHLYTIFHGYAK